MFENAANDVALDVKNKHCVEGAPMSESKILFATDFEGNLRHGLRLATELSVRYSATLLLLHVVPFRANDGEALLHRVLEVSSQRPGQVLKSLAPTDPEIPYRHILETGEPEERILDVAKREGVKHIVLEIRPRSLLRGMLRRSMVKYVAARAPCPVVTYRAPRPCMDTSAGMAAFFGRVARGAADYTPRTG